MNRVYVLVEGQTEEAFVNNVLNPFLNPLNVSLYAILFRKQSGSFSYENCRKIIQNALKKYKSSYITMLIDFYGLPKNWPGRKDADNQRSYLDKAVTVENALSSDISTQLGSSFNPLQFVPYVQMYEFEALLFSDTAVWTDKKISGRLEQIKQSFSCPEEINDNYETCPSRRIANIFESCGQKYSKVIDGINASQKIGLSIIRQECPHFNEWLAKLESLGTK